jgi:predicted nucleic acid-binding protein
MFVVDTSVTMAWCFADETTPYTQSVLQRLRAAEARVPTIWPVEVANVLLVGRRRGRLTDEQVARFHDFLRNLVITIDQGSTLDHTLGPILNMGRVQGLTAYDACYLELATREGLPLATQDDRLREAAQRVGVPLLS